MKIQKLSKVIWFTGLSGSGKTTLSKKLSNRLKKKKLKVFSIDGDSFRKKSKNKKFNKRNIILNNNLIIDFIKKIYNKYDYILVSVISPLLKTRKKAKKTFKKNYIEIYVKCNPKILKKRDTKGLYKLAKLNKLKNLIGFNSKISYEKSNYKVIMIDTGILSISKSLLKISNYIDNQNV